MAEKITAYCVKCRKKTVMKNPKIETLPNKRKAWVGTCNVCGTKQVRIVSEAEAAKVKEGK